MSNFVLKIMYQASNFFLVNQAILFREKQRKTIRFQIYNYSMFHIIIKGNIKKFKKEILFNDVFDTLKV